MKLPLGAGPVAIYGATVLLHVWLLASYFHAGIGAYYVPVGGDLIGSFIGDEALYRLYAENIRHLEAYPHDALYPPAYPVLLALAESVSPSDPIKAMMIANILVACAVVFPVYAMTRQFLSKTMSYAAAAVAGVLPATFIFTPALMSENLFTTLFAVAFWLTVRNVPATILSSGFLGLALTLCFLCKFLFLPLAPFFVTAFLLGQWRIVNNAHRVRRLALLSVAGFMGALVPAAPWVVYVMASGGGLHEALGLHVATLATTQRPPLDTLPTILGLHLLALISSVLPFLPAAIIGLRPASENRTMNYSGLLVALSLFLLLYVSFYAWIATSLFGYPQPIVQRYMMMLVPIFIPPAFLGLARLLDLSGKRPSWRELVMVIIVTVVLAIFVRLGLYDRLIWPVPSWVTTIWVGAPDVLYGALGFPVVAISAFTALVHIVAHVINNERYRTGVLFAATLAWVMFGICAGVAGAKFAWDNPYLAVNTAHAKAISKILDDRSHRTPSITIAIDQSVIESINGAAQARMLSPERWSVNLWYWSGRMIHTSETQTALTKEMTFRYRVSLAQPGADPAGTYLVGSQRFQVSDMATE